MFNQDELKNIAVLINRANITGQEALAVAVLLQKIDKMMIEVPAATSPDTAKATKGK